MSLNVAYHFKFVTCSEHVDNILLIRILLDSFEIACSSLGLDAFFGEIPTPIPPSSDKRRQQNAKQQSIKSKHIIAIRRLDDPLGKSNTNTKLLFSIRMTILFVILSNGIVGQTILDVPNKEIRFIRLCDVDKQTLDSFLGHIPDKFDLVRMKGTTQLFVMRFNLVEGCRGGDS